MKLREVNRRAVQWEVVGQEINMARTEFIKVEIVSSGKESAIQFLNRNHILRIYTEADTVCIEMIDYTVFKLHSENIMTFMDRFAE